LARRRTRSARADKPAGAGQRRVQQAEPPAADDPGEVSDSGFAKLGLSPVMLETLRSVGYLEPTPVQEGLIPRAMAGVDVMGQAKTGTG